MAKVDDVKDAIEDALPVGRSRPDRRLPAVLVVALLAGAAAVASRLEPVRSAVRKAVSAVRTRVASMRGRGTYEQARPMEDVLSGGAMAGAAGATAGAAESSVVGSGESVAAPFEAPTTDLAVADASAVAPSDVGEDEGDTAPPAPESIPADSEEGRPAGV